MTGRAKTLTFALAFVLVFGFAGASGSQEPPALQLKEGDRVVLLGNTFAERMRYYGYLETSLSVLFPELGLTFRNLGWSADEVTLRPRPLDFGSIHDHLTKQQADVVFVCFGLNESFAGPKGVEAFETNLVNLLNEMRGQNYNGESAPRLVLVSPMPQEALASLPDPAKRNDVLAQYVDAMKRAAATVGIPFVDLFAPFTEFMRAANAPKLTFNGIHMEAHGYWLATREMVSQLGYAPAAKSLEVDLAKAVPSGDVISVKVLEGGAAFELRVDRFPLPPSPERDETTESARLVVRGLQPGRYALRHGADLLAAASHREWASGVYVDLTVFDDEVEAIRALEVEKAQLFFDRWRAVNGFYIYGGRKEPFGVVSFPPEMERFDELIGELDRKIIAASQPPAAVSFELVLTDQ